MGTGTGNADGYYFNINGFFYGQEGTSTKVKLCTGISSYKCFKNDKPLKQKLYVGIIETDIEFEDLIELAATTYGESSLGRKNTVQKERKEGEKMVKYNVEVDIKDSELRLEARALACCVFNYKNKRDHDNYVKSVRVVYNPIISQVIKDMGAFAQGKPNYKVLKKKSKTPELFNKMQQFHIEAGLLAHIRDQQKKGKLKGISTIQDFANGALLWDGVDLKDNYNNHEKVNNGYFVSNEKHNVLGIKSKKITIDSSKPKNDKDRFVKDSVQCYDLRSKKDVSFAEKKCYSYKYATTCGHAKSMFVKLSDEYEAAIIHSLREKTDNTYILNPWW
ncbi:hypothetical protein [Flavobacterium piscisymbiosum]|uniref:Uncharacterized protein n=1 Tax=Flavobacterium piscisymbiosum TaxID=2893753 RepID=A0ABS8MFI8_9FLAO|nr:hypothetical protein [Flavobacterium sp. F-30]MCC9064128.1 hypothetical protein [Flavobacterium sp. F-30]